MKAKEFIKRYGWREAKRVLYDARGCVSVRLYDTYEFTTDELKEYVDAYRVIQDCGGLREAKEWLQKDIQDEYWDDASVTRERSILLVEEIEQSC